MGAWVWVWVYVWVWVWVCGCVCECVSAPLAVYMTRTKQIQGMQHTQVTISWLHFVIVRKAFRV